MAKKRWEQVKSKFFLAIKSISIPRAQKQSPMSNLIIAIPYENQFPLKIARDH